MVYSDTHVTAGRARAVVAATGTATEIGNIAALAVAAEQMKTPLERRIAGLPIAQVQTETCTVLAACQCVNVLNCRSERRSAQNLSILTNPWLIGGLVAGTLLQVAVISLRPLGDVLLTVPIDLFEVFAIGAMASLVLWVEELRNLLVRAQGRSRLALAAGAGR